MSVWCPGKFLPPSTAWQPDQQVSGECWLAGPPPLSFEPFLGILTPACPACPGFCFRSVPRAVLGICAVTSVGH